MYKKAPETPIIHSYSSNSSESNYDDLNPLPSHSSNIKNKSLAESIEVEIPAKFPIELPKHMEESVELPEPVKPTYRSAVLEEKSES